MVKEKGNQGLFTGGSECSQKKSHSKEPWPRNYRKQVKKGNKKWGGTM